MLNFYIGLFRHLNVRIVLCEMRSIMGFIEYVEAKQVISFVK